MKVVVCLLALFVSNALYAGCMLPGSISAIAVPADSSVLRGYPDSRRHFPTLRKMCTYTVAFTEGKQYWKMLLVFHPKRPRGAFWFLPHDNENTAFDSAVYAVKRYGGGFLSVLSGGSRYHQGQDPNRNFSGSSHKLRSCRYQKSASPRYTKTVFGIIDSFRGAGFPYLALHNNTDGGGVSILKSSKSVRSFLAYPKEKVRNRSGLMDEDSLVYIAGRSSAPPRRKIEKLLRYGIHTKYEIVNRSNNDCSMSNYVVLDKGTDRYYNIEVQHGDASTQRKMIDILMRRILR